MDPNIDDFTDEDNLDSTENIQVSGLGVKNTEVDADNIQTKTQPPVQTTEKPGIEGLGDDDFDENDNLFKNDTQEAVTNEENSNSQVDFTPLTELIFSELNIEFKPEYLEDNSAAGLSDVIKNIVEQLSVPTFASKDVERLNEFVSKGGTLKEFARAVTPIEDINLEEIDLSKVVNKKLLAELHLKETTNLTDEKRAKFINGMVAQDQLDDYVNDEALPALREISSKKQEGLIAAKEQERQAQEKVIQDLQLDTIRTIDNLTPQELGFDIDDQKKSKLKDFIYKKGKDGMSDYERYFSSGKLNSLKVAYMLMNNLTDEKAVTSKSKELLFKQIEDSAKKASGKATGSVQNRVETKKQNQTFKVKLLD